MSIIIRLLIIIVFIAIPPTVVYLVYKKQIEKFDNDIVRQDGKKCLSPTKFGRIAFEIWGVTCALIIYQYVKIMSFM